jgi:simple sugar transport system permease protein
MTATGQAVRGPVADTSDRVRRVNPLRRVLVRPEMGAIAGSIAVWVFFALVAGRSGFLSLSGTATYLQVAAELGILAVAVSLLMIGGEFDLSIGSMLGATGMLLTVLSVQYHWNVWPAMLVALAFALVVGFVNGYLVLSTGLPSFIVTLGTLYILRGATIGATRLVTGRTQIGGLDQADGYASAKAIFASSVNVVGATFSVSIVWWLIVAAIATWLLLRTSFGNWIFGVGGNVQAASNVGVPVGRVKIALFMGTAVAATLVAIIQAIAFTGSDVLRGTGQEFYAIIAVVIGGTLLTGGYGSAIGAVFGALIFGMVRQGIVFARVDADWFQVVLGFMLLAAVLVNRFVRGRAMRSA